MSRDLAEAYGGVRIRGFDLAPIQVFNSSDVRNLRLEFYVYDANDDYWAPGHEYDFIHMRGLDGGIKNWQLSLQTAFQCLRRGGFIEVSDISLVPSPRPTPGSFWQGLQALFESYGELRGFRFGIHNNGQINDELTRAGYVVVRSDPIREYALRRDTHVYGDDSVLQSVVEQMKGTIYRVCEELLHPIVYREQLLDQLEELRQQGCTIAVWVLVLLLSLA